MPASNQRLSIETPWVADGKPAWHRTSGVLEMTASTRVPANVIREYAGEPVNAFTARRTVAESFLAGVGYTEVVIDGLRAKTLNDIYEAEMHGGGIKPTDLIDAVHEAIQRLEVSPDSDNFDLAC